MPDSKPSDAVTAAFCDRATRRDRDREVPLGPKATRTRRAILEAAAREFEANGYQHTTVGQVAAAAGVSLGAVYQYFRDRSDLVAALCQRHLTHMLDSSDAVWRWEDGLEGLNRAVLNFVRSYHDAAGMAGIWEEVAHVDPELADLRRALGRIFTRAVERSLTRIPDLEVDPALAATALTGMVDRYCYVTYVFDPPAGGPPSPEESAEVLSRLWAAAIGLLG